MLNSQRRATHTTLRSRASIELYKQAGPLSIFADDIGMAFH